jgi:ribosomal protein S30
MEYNYILTSEGELYHWGIKGQKWGVRRYQNKNGSLTPAGKKRYYDTPELNSLKADMDKAKVRRSESLDILQKASDRKSYLPTAKNRSEYDKAKARYLEDDLSYRTARLKYKTDKEVARIEDKGIEFKDKSKHRLKLEEQYKSLGMTDEQAQAAANNRIRTEKILASSAALTVGACAAYIAVKSRRDRIDGIIKAGESLQRIEMEDTGGKLHKVFYASKGKHDNTRYERLLGAARKNQTGKAYMMKLQADSDIHVASKNKAAKTFGDLYKNDSDFRKSVEEHVQNHFAGGNRVRDINNLSDRNIKKMYDNFNSNLPFMRRSGADQKFYSKLKEAGYGAIQDVNDMKFSGYNAKNPLIVFDNAKNNIMVKSMKEMTGNLDGKSTVELLKATGEEQVKYILTTLGPVSAVGLSAATATTYRSDPSKQYKTNN